jgi:hypothetical protein
LLLGYVEFMALLFLPGMAFMEIFELGGEFSFAERLGLAFGLSMAVDVLVLVARTSGINIGGKLMVGIGPETLEIMLAASLVALAAPILLRRRFTLWVKPERLDLYVLGLVLAQALLVVAHFYKYPIFPQFSSVDFSQHVMITGALQSGETTVFPGGILYYGVHLLMGSLVALSGDIVLVATQYAMAILAALSPLLVFVSVASLTSSKRAGLVGSLLYVATGFIWFGSVFDSGLYANFYGILSILLLFAVVPAVLKQPRNPGLWLALILAVGSGYFSHYSYVTVIPALVALPIAVFVIKRKVSIPAIAVAAVLVVPGVIAAALRPDLVTLLIQFVTAPGGGNVPVDTTISKYLAGWPVLRYIVVEVADDLGAIVTIALAALGVYVAVRLKNPAVWMVVVWLVAILAVAPFTETAWRFSYMALVPLLILAALGFDFLIPETVDRRLRQRNKVVGRREERRWRLGVLGVVFLMLFVDSWSWQLVGDAATDGGISNQTQHGILEAMEWMDANTPADSQVASITNSNFNYYLLVYGRESGYAPLATPVDIISASNGTTAPTYVVLTTYGTVALPNATSDPFNIYPSDTSFQLVYNQSGVVVFQLKG